MINKIGGKRKSLLIFISILTVGGHFYTGKYLDYKKEITLSLRKVDSESRTEYRLLDTLDKSISILKALKQQEYNAGQKGD